jgi:hypothetical protein
MENRTRKSFASLKPEKRSIKPFLFFSAWLLLLSTEIYLFVHDTPLFQDFTHREKSEAKKKPAAEIAEQSNRVRYQESNDLVWHEADLKQTLYEGQSVLTLDGSAARIDFYDGAKFFLGENSLIQIQKNREDPGESDQVLIKIVKGSIEAQTTDQNSSRITIQSRDTEIKLTSKTEFSLKSKEKGSSQLIVKKGEVTVDQKKGAPLKAKAGNTLELSKDSMQKVSYALTPVLPKGGETVDLYPEEKLTFILDRSQDLNLNKTQIEFSKTEDFQSLFTGFDFEIDPKSTTQSIIIKHDEFFERLESDQRLFWRITGENSQKNTNLSPAQSIYLKIPPKPKLYLPLDQSLVIAKNPIEFLWDDIPGMESYELEIRLLRSSSKNQGEIVKQKSTESNQLMIQGLLPGLYSWRMRGQTKSSQKSFWSEQRIFQVKPADSLPPPQIEGLEFFQKNTQNSKSEKTRSISRNAARWVEAFLFGPTAEAQEVNPVKEDQTAEPTFKDSKKKEQWDVVLKWKEVPGASEYRIQIAPTRSFKKLELDETTKKTEITWSYVKGAENSLGRLWFRIASIDILGDQGDFSDPRPLVIPDRILKEEKPKKVIPQKKPPRKAPKTIKKPFKRSWQRPRWELRAGLGLAQREQNSDTRDYPPVSNIDPYLFQNIQSSLSFKALALPWYLNGRLTLSSFDASKDTNLLFQEEEASVRLDASLYWDSPLLKSFYIGPYVSVGDRWKRSSPQSVESELDLSLGTSLSWQPQAFWGISLHAPITGVLHDSFYGARIGAWLESDLFIKPIDNLLKGLEISSRLTSEWSYLQWEPEDPTETAISTSLLLVVRKKEE